MLGRMGKTESLVDVTRDERGFTMKSGGVEARVWLIRDGSCAYLARATDDEGAASVASLATLARALYGELATCEELVSWDQPERTRFNDALRAAGFRDHRRKLFVMRDLTDDLPPGGSFTWRTLAEVGEEAFVELMTRSSDDDPFPDDDFDPQEEWRELVAHAGEAFDPDRWRVAIVDGEPAGVVLPTPYPDAPTEGTLSYIGILPAFRGRGLGRDLHASGLRLLADAGCTVYKGSTDQRNEPMARVFARNGCPVDGIQLFLKLA